MPMRMLNVVAVPLVVIVFAEFLFVTPIAVVGAAKGTAPGAWLPVNPQNQDGGESSGPADVTLATVDGLPIWRSQVEFQLRQAFPEDRLDADLASRLRREILEQLIDQRLALIQLAESRFEASDDEVDLEINRIAERAERLGMSLADWLEKSGQSEPGLRFGVRWQISWKRYVEATVTDEVLQRYFESHQPRWDGTRLKVSHLVKRKSASTTATESENMRAELEQIRESIQRGDQVWAEAVARYSESPAAEDGGAVGWIDADGPMPVPFTEAAFALDEGDISLPVETAFGWHLIRVESVEAGTIPWYERKPALRKVVVRLLLQRLAEKQRPLSEIEILTTGMEQPKAGQRQDP